MKISFLVAAHNEEKLIAQTLENLLKIPYNNFEIIVGLDGCTDKTEEIVKKYSSSHKKIKYYTLNLRSGKPAVINNIIKKSTGEILLIHDADWLFENIDKNKFSKLLSVFKDKKIGGIAEAFPMEWHKNNLKNANFGYKMIANSTYCWMESEKKKYSIEKDGLHYLMNPAMFMTNIMRKSLFKPNTSLGDDFERTRDILDQDSEVVFFDNWTMPRRRTSYNKISVRDLFKQKIRTAIARNQLSKKNNKLPKRYYSKSILGTLIESIKNGFAPFGYTLYWVALTGIASIIAEFKKLNTKEGWSLRAKR